MPFLKSCCLMLMARATPASRSLGTKVEPWTCEECKSTYGVEFECFEIDGKVECAARRAKY